MRSFLVAAVVLPLAAITAVGCAGKPKKATLKVFCAAGVKAPVESLARQFTDASVSLELDGTNTLLTRIQTLPQRDLPGVFVAAEETYVRRAIDLGLVDRSEVIGYFTPVIVVSRKYTGPKIESLADLARPGLRVVLGEARGPAIGVVSDKLLADAGLAEVARTAQRRGKVQDVALPVSVGAADAAIIWEDIARQGDFATTLDIVRVPNAPLSRIYICRVANAPDKGLADKFIDLVVSQAGQEAFRQAGFMTKPATTQQD